uniref:Superfamily Cerm-11 n=1 Tax=Conus magus TaxID=6492 RepID=A0A679PJ59_CONMA|nr:TPA_inf: superfamily Cerm-11 [Conus magus]
MSKMEFRRLVTVALLLTLVLSIDSAPADQTETGRISLRETDETFPCDAGKCACSPKNGDAEFICKDPSASTDECADGVCTTAANWG